MIINLTDEAIITPFTEGEINEQVTRLLAFCRINKHSQQIQNLEVHLLKLEEAVAVGKFEN